MSWGWIPARELIDFNIEFEVSTPRGKLQYMCFILVRIKASSSPGRWKRHLTSDSSGTGNFLWFSSDIWQILDRKYFRVRLIFGVGKGTLMIFRRCHEPGNSLLRSKYFSLCGVGLRASMADFISRWFLYNIFRSICQGRTTVFFEAVLDLSCPQNQVHRLGRVSQLVV